MFHNLLFDLDGTLTDAGGGITACIQHALRSLGEPEADAEALNRCLGPPLWDSFGELMTRPSSERIAAAVAAYRERFVRVGMFENRLYPEIVPTLEKLVDRGFRLFVVTSKPHVYASKITDHFHISSNFQRIHGPELDDEASTKTTLIKGLLAEENIEASSAVMIGDRALDVAGARNNGVCPVGVLWGYGSRDELVGAGAETVLGSPPELLHFLDGSGEKNRARPQ